ncbi:MAG: aminotransferase class I/II-fold pyridoxal phosphate-dependent enzyme [Candidatus Bathyarchaeia archaeon]
MKFRPFSLEDWFAKYELQCRINISESGILPIDSSWFDTDLSDLKLYYGHMLGDLELRELIARDYPDLLPDRILVTTGCIEANFVAFASLVQPGDHVIVEHPNYQQLYEVPRALGSRVELLRLRYEDNYKLNVDELNEMVTPRTKLIVISHPNNPTGSVITLETLKSIIEIVEDNNIYLLSDEIYRELSFTHKPLPPAATLSDHAISNSSMSKLHGLPGLRIGWMAADKAIINTAKEIRSYTTICNSTLGEHLSKLALKRKEELVTRAEKIAKTNLEVMRRWVESRDDVDWVPPEGSLVTFPRFYKNVTSTELCKLLAEKYKVFVAPGKCFDIESHFRVGFGWSTDELREGLEFVGRALDSFEPLGK